MPDDRYHAIYFAMLLAGVGFLLPYNSFITDVDYLHHKYPGGSLCHPHRPHRWLRTSAWSRAFWESHGGGPAWREWTDVVFGDTVGHLYCAR